MFYMHFLSYYDIYWTNLLTRCHSASFCLLCLCIAEKVQKWKCSEKSEKITEILKRQKTPGARRTIPAEAHSPHTMGPRGQKGVAPWHGVAASVTSSRRPLDYIASAVQTQKGSTISPEEFRSSAATKNPNSGDRSLCFGTLPGRGIAPGAISIDTTASIIAVAASHDEEGVVLHRGWGLYR